MTWDKEGPRIELLYKLIGQIRDIQDRYASRLSEDGLDFLAFLEMVYILRLMHLEEIS